MTNTQEERKRVRLLTKNKSNPLRGKECKADKYSDVNFNSFKSDDVVSACTFYHYYHNDYEQFTKDYSHILRGKMYIWMNSHNFDSEDERFNEFNCWLFDYTFGDAVKCRFM